MVRRISNHITLHWKICIAITKEALIVIKWQAGFLNWRGDALPLAMCRLSYLNHLLKSGLYSLSVFTDYIRNKREKKNKMTTSVKGRERESERASERTRERERERKWESEREERESERTRARARERESEKDYAEYAINNSILINVNEWKTLIFTEIIIWISINLMPWNERKINTSVTKTIFFFYFLILNSWKSDIFCGSLKNWIED